MTYAVTATYKLSAAMASSTVCELIVGRYNSLDGAREGRDEAKDDDLVKGISSLLWNELDGGITVEFGIMAE